MSDCRFGASPVNYPDPGWIPDNNNDAGFYQTDVQTGNQTNLLFPEHGGSRKVFPGAPVKK